MNARTKEFREKIANEFVKVLEENPLTWKKSWQANQLLPHNAVTGRKYNGINMFYLNLLAKDNMWEDPRFATFKQIQNAGWKLKKGSEGIQIEYWMPYDAENHKAMTWDAYKQLTDEEKKEICIKPKYSYVFNAKDIEGIPAMPEPEIHEVNPDKIIDTISKNMKVEIVNDGGSRAFYRPSDDKVHLPKAEYFNDSAAYNSVALHELAHASGAPNRLNRDLSGSFGTPSYAYEELIAEISSAFMSSELAQPVSDFEMENHKAYVQSWIQAIKDRPETLFKAIKDAEKCSNYLSYQAELISEKEYEKLTQDSDMKGKNEKEIEKNIIKSGHKPTERMIGNIKQINHLTGRENTMKDICRAFKERTYADQPKIDELVSAIAEECKIQETLRAVSVQCV